MGNQGQCEIIILLNEFKIKKHPVNTFLEEVYNKKMRNCWWFGELFISFVINKLHFVKKGVLARQKVFKNKRIILIRKED